jgi:hypothetical protein
MAALGVFRCGTQDSDAIGGTADMGLPPAPIASEVYDPKRTQRLCATLVLRGVSVAGL